MKTIRITTLFLALTFLACTKKSNKVETKTIIEQNTPSAINDTTKLEKLTKDLYKWTETKSSQIDFDPIQIEKTDTIYNRIDIARHKQRILELKATNFFDNKFIENYNKIALTIDKKMMEKSFVYYIGELPPYGNDANPWCNCQDNPDQYWKKLKIENIKIKDENASYNWTWGDNFKYKVRAVKENGLWKISYLQGFDINEFIQTEEN